MDSNTLLAYQADYYKTSKVMEQINNANANELNLLNDRIKLIKDNYDIDTADKKTITRWENELKLKVLPNDPIDYRRIRIKSRILGQGDFSVQMIKDISKNYPNGDVSVNLNLSGFEVIIKFISVIGTPPNIADFKNAIEEVKPPYMVANYLYSYLLIKEINTMKIKDLNNTKLNKFAGGA